MTDTPDNSLIRFQSSAFFRSVVIFVAIGASLYLSAMLWFGWEQAIATIRKLGILTLVVGGVIASSAYLWRFARWHYLLSRFGYRVSKQSNFNIYLAGLALTVSPGKLGETVRSLMLMPHDVKAGHSLGAFLADRLSDVIGVCFLGIVAGIINGRINWLLAIIAMSLLGVSLFASYAITHPASGGFWEWLAEKIKWLPIRGGQAVLKSWAALWSPLRAITFAFVAVAAFGIQAGVFSWYCHLAGIDISSADAVAIFVNATLFGAASMLPGGLGAMEAALVLQLTGYGVENSLAVSVAIATRLVTLWLGVLLGVWSLWVTAR
ncbi:MAG: lysylphosphatidylglycerol synthase transmembrane domain-containing protein [Sulfuricaulis sp.]|uniref:lysylphosphatidylglycerol synthase transmembrane domain-containing protein n=1 Tax=Sulfuricaulis sp. TaxID=2003553 RepID=UPI003C40BF63